MQTVLGCYLYRVVKSNTKKNCEAAMYLVGGASPCDPFRLFPIYLSCFFFLCNSTSIPSTLLFSCSCSPSSSVVLLLLSLLSLPPISLPSTTSFHCHTSKAASYMSAATSGSGAKTRGRKERIVTITIQFWCLSFSLLPPTSLLSRSLPLSPLSFVLSLLQTLLFFAGSCECNLR